MRRGAVARRRHDPLTRRLAAIVLVATFISAIVEFGEIDAIGHLLTVAAPAVIAIEQTPASRYPRPVWLPGCFVVALFGIEAAYCAAHVFLISGLDVRP